MAERKLYPSEKQDRLIVRFPDGMRDRIAALAKANKRSMNAEVISMIEASQAPSRKPVPVVSENTTEVGELKDSMKELKVEIAEFRATLTKFADALVPDFATQEAIRPNKGKPQPSARTRKRPGTIPRKATAK
jgi:hypothetical protein